MKLINPMNESAPGSALTAPRLNSLAGRTIALLDISKPGGSIFLDRMEHLLKERYGVGTVHRVMKPAFSKPAPADVIERIRGVDAVVEGLAD